MEDLYGAYAYVEGYGPHRKEVDQSTGPLAVRGAEVEVELVSPVSAVEQAMELRG
jgi:hypothetical protein